MIHKLESEMIDQLEIHTVVVAGCSSGAGKTSVAETVTEILSRVCQTGAAKITVTHGDRGCPHGGKGCNVCSSLGGDFQVIVKDSVILQPGTDTARLVAAGGNPVVWAIARDIAIESAWREMKTHLKSADCVVIESNSLAEHIVPTMTLMVLDPSVSRKIWKPSAERLIASADWVVFNDRGSKEKRERLLKEVERLRGNSRQTIIVSHPHEIRSHPEFVQNLKSSCLAGVALGLES